RCESRTKRVGEENGQVDVSASQPPRSRHNALRPRATVVRYDFIEPIAALENARDIWLENTEQVIAAEMPSQRAQSWCRHDGVADPFGEKDCKLHASRSQAPLGNAGREAPLLVSVPEAKRSFVPGVPKRSLGTRVRPPPAGAAGLSSNSPR